MLNKTYLSYLIFYCFLLSCGSHGSSPGTGRVQIIVVPEASITEGIKSGNGDEDMHDGWQIQYNKFLISLGYFEAQRTDTKERLFHDKTYILDLKNAPAQGYLVTEWDRVPAARFDKFSYRTVNAQPSATILEPTSSADLELMIQNNYSIYFEGVAQKGNEKITFKWGFNAGTSFEDCASEDGFSGFAVPLNGSVQIKPTIHGDHQYFDNITQGVELTKRLGAWMNICNQNKDGILTTEELKSCVVQQALPTPPYDLTGIKDQDNDHKITVYDYVNSQMRTLGDYQGSGECPTRKPFSL